MIICRHLSTGVVVDAADAPDTYIARMRSHWLTIIRWRSKTEGAPQHSTFIFLGANHESGQRAFDQRPFTFTPTFAAATLMATLDFFLSSTNVAFGEPLRARVCVCYSRRAPLSRGLVPSPSPLPSICSRTMELVLIECARHAPHEETVVQQQRLGARQRQRFDRTQPEPIICAANAHERRKKTTQTRKDTPKNMTQNGAGGRARVKRRVLSQINEHKSIFKTYIHTRVNH